ncbi:hypothetical protein [Polaribacter sp.]|uniref:hypothetical protein n=1 Tax=Polaribacter sp. TaxID=1920175 RepID=UPI003F6C1D79
MKYKLEEILIEYEDLKRNKSKVYKNVIFTLIVGFIIVFCGFFYWKSFINDRYLLSRSHLEYLIIVVGLFFIIGSVFIKKSLHKYKFYKNSLHYNEKSKEQMQSLLNLYNKKYRYKIKFGKEFNDEQDVFFNIDVF